MKKHAEIDRDLPENFHPMEASEFIECFHIPKDLEVKIDNVLDKYGKEIIKSYLSDTFIHWGIKSPIEKLFLSVLLFTDIFDAYYRIKLQHKIGNFYVDFLFLPNVVVELDGHQWHEKTKDQAARDKQRERYLVGAGYKILRFTGSEIWKDPVACANELKQILESERKVKSGKNKIHKA